jgi:hypothetical protein
MDIFDLARESKPFSERLDAWMQQADESLFAWLDGYLAGLLDAQKITDDQRVSLITMLSMSASRGASSRQ